MGCPPKPPPCSPKEGQALVGRVGGHGLGADPAVTTAQGGDILQHPHPKAPISSSPRAGGSCGPPERLIKAAPSPWHQAVPKPLSAAGCPSSQVASVAKQFLPGQGPGMVGVSLTPRRGWHRPAGVGGTHPSTLSPFPRSLAPVPGVPAGFEPGAAARDGGRAGSNQRLQGGDGSHHPTPLLCPSRTARPRRDIQKANKARGHAGSSQQGSSSPLQVQGLVGNPAAHSALVHAGPISPHLCLFILGDLA